MPEAIVVGAGVPVGNELARWIVEDAPRREALKTYNLDRFDRGDLIFGEYEPVTRGPH